MRESITMKKPKDFPEYRLHKWLTEVFDRRMPEWVKENKELEKKAWAGEDEPFFELLRRNPEYFKTDLAMGKIMEWY